MAEKADVAVVASAFKLQSPRHPIPNSASHRDESMIDEDACTRSKLEVTAREENVLKRRDVCGVVVPGVNGYVQA